MGQALISVTFASSWRSIVYLAGMAVDGICYGYMLPVTWKNAAQTASLGSGVLSVEFPMSPQRRRLINIRSASCTSKVSLPAGLGLSVSCDLDHRDGGRVEHYQIADDQNYAAGELPSPIFAATAGLTTMWDRHNESGDEIPSSANLVRAIDKPALSWSASAST